MGPVRRFFAFLTALTVFLASAGLGYANEIVSLPKPGILVQLSASFQPPVLKGIKVYPDNPFHFDFILDKGVAKDSDEQVRTESYRLLKYFLASLTVPEKDLWVNLSPYEKDRVIPAAFGQTEMGRDLLVQDYLLKQITASLLYPDGKTGREFWDKVYAQARNRYGTVDIPVETFNKVWIVPDKTTVYANQNAAFVVESRLKVMLEEDYLALEKSAAGADGSKASSSDEFLRDIAREILIPLLEKEINEGENFAQLRQICNSLVLAMWFKQQIKASLLGQAYVDQRKISGIDIADKNESMRIWDQYVDLFKKGAYNFIKEEADPETGESIPRKYCSGGIVLAQTIDFAQDLPVETSKTLSTLSVDMTMDLGVRDQKAEKPEIGVVGMFFGAGSYKSYLEVGPAFYRDGSPEVKAVYEEAATVLGQRPEDLFINSTHIIPERGWADSFLFTAMTIYNLALQAQFVEKSRSGGHPVRFKGYSADSLGIIQAAIASGAVSLRDGLLLAQAVPAVMWDAVQNTGNKPFYIYFLKNADILDLLPQLKARFGEDFMVFRYAAKDEVSVFIGKEKEAEFLKFLAEKRIAMRQPNKETTTAVIHTDRLKAGRVALEKIILENGIQFSDPGQPIFSSHPMGELKTAADVKEGILGILDEPAHSKAMFDLVDSSASDFFVQLGRGTSNRVYMVERNAVKTPFFEFDGGAEQEARLMAHLRQKDNAMTSPAADRDQPALVANKNDLGGIDLTEKRFDLKTKGAQNIQFQFDPALLGKMQASSGLSPVILKIQALDSLPQFMGVAASPT